LPFLHSMNNNGMIMANSTIYCSRDWFTGEIIDCSLQYHWISVYVREILITMYFVLAACISVIVFGLLIACSKKDNRWLSIALLVELVVLAVICIVAVVLTDSNRIFSGRYGIWQGFELIAVIGLATVAIVLVSIYLAKVFRGRITVDIANEELVLAIPTQKEKPTKVARIKPQQPTIQNRSSLEEKVSTLKGMKEEGLLTETSYKEMLLELMSKE